MVVVLLMVLVVEVVLVEISENWLQQSDFFPCRLVKELFFQHISPLFEVICLKSSWCFQIFCIFTSTWGNDPILRAYFSNELKPPTRNNWSIGGEFLASQNGHVMLPWCLTIPSLPNTLWVGVWTHKPLLRRPLGGPNTYSQGIWGILED